MTDREVQDCKTESQDLLNGLDSGDHFTVINYPPTSKYMSYKDELLGFYGLSKDQQIMLRKT